MFELKEEYKILQAEVRKFVARELKSEIINEFEEKGTFPIEFVKKVGELGWMGVAVPEKYGGAEMDNLAYAIVIEELARAWGSFALIVSANQSLSGAPIYDWGTEEQKLKYLVPLASGKKLGCYALTEPDAGSDAANQKTTAKLDGSHYVISGKKRLITNVNQAGICVLIARTGPDRYKGLSAFIVEIPTPGFNIDPPEKKMGLKCSPACGISLEDCRVPKENLLGGEGNGWAVAMKTLNGGRISIAAQSIGIAQCAIDEAKRHALARKQFGEPIANFQMVQAMFAEMSVEIEAARLLTWKAAWLKDQGLPEKELAPHSARAKLFASEKGKRIVDLALQVFGGDGYIWGSAIERCYRDIRATPLYEGTSEVQKIIIARDLLK